LWFHVARQERIVAHEKNYTPEQVKENLEWYYDNLSKQKEAREELDQNVAQEAQDKLRGDWGEDFRRNMNMIHGWLGTGAESVKDKILGGRGPDGTPMGSDPEILEFFANTARQINPVTTIVPAGTENIASAVEDEISKIERTMREDRKAYNKDDKMQARYRELLGFRDKQKKSA